MIRWFYDFGYTFSKANRCFIKLSPAYFVIILGRLNPLFTRKSSSFRNRIPIHNSHENNKRKVIIIGTSHPQLQIGSSCLKRITNGCACVFIGFLCAKMAYGIGNEFITFIRLVAHGMNRKISSLIDYMANFDFGYDLSNNIFDAFREVWLILLDLFRTASSPQVEFGSESTEKAGYCNEKYENLEPSETIQTDNSVQALYSDVFFQITARLAAIRNNPITFQHATHNACIFRRIQTLPKQILYFSLPHISTTPRLGSSIEIALRNLKVWNVHSVVNWFAVDRGKVMADYNMGLVYSKGEFIGRNKDLASKHFEIASMASHGKSRVNFIVLMHQRNLSENSLD